MQKKVTMKGTSVREGKGVAHRYLGVNISDTYALLKV